MRLLNMTAIDAMFHKITVHLSLKSRCRFDFVSAELISGEQEALLAYLSLNELLDQDDFIQNPQLKEQPKELGILDMGGATTQVAFYPQRFLREEETRFYVKNTR